MPLAYDVIREENKKEYGAGIGRIGSMLLADRYDDRTHFIYELLQNAEDALARRPPDWTGSRAIHFELAGTELRVRHAGQPFDEKDVRGVCGIGESTKKSDLTSIGRFGIGFKSVFAVTNRPIVHSGDEDFAIESFVWPTQVEPIKRKPDDTVIRLELLSHDKDLHGEIKSGLHRLGPRTLLFLRQLEEVQWSVEGGPSGFYQRSQREHLGGRAHRIRLIGQQHGQPEVEESWLVFSREMLSPHGAVAGHVELAFYIEEAAEDAAWRVRAVTDSPLVVFFPTVVQTHLGFLLQGPFQTTPSRDNIPRLVAWNKQVVREASALLREALGWLRDNRRLDTSALRCLPLDRARFDDDHMLLPLFETARDALRTEPLLPTSSGEYVPARSVRLARTQELRDLFGSEQLAALARLPGKLYWLPNDITQDRAPEIRRYLMQELAIQELTPESILSNLTKPFLEAQPDAWIVRLYEFLHGQPALQKRFSELPLVRLANGQHVVARENGQIKAFLPGPTETGFPTARRSVCSTNIARAFLTALGLTLPDPVDDVVHNVLPNYRTPNIHVTNTKYAEDIRRIRVAFRTDLKSLREKLLNALRESYFVMASDAGDATRKLAKPTDVYIATDQFKALFADVQGVLLVDDSLECLRGEEARDLLEACGARRRLERTFSPPNFSWEELWKMRIEAGCENSSRPGSIWDWSLRGLDGLLERLPRLGAAERIRRAGLLWDALCDFEAAGSSGTFQGTYEWFYHNSRTAHFDAAFVRKLNTTPWVPDAKGALQLPEFVLFDSLGWKANPVLESKINFKPPIIITLAQAAGIDPGVLDLLKKLGLTSEAELRKQLRQEALAVGGDDEEDDQGSPPNASPGSDGQADNASGAEHDDHDGRSEDSDSREAMDSGSDHERTRKPSSGSGSSSKEHGSGHATGSGSATQAGAGSGGSAHREFISYVSVEPGGGEPDPDGLDQQARMDLEEKAIQLILAFESDLQRTPTHNPGFDLFAGDQDGEPCRWVEVKAMKGSLDDHPVGLSHTQFKCAQEHGEAYSLYVVEHAGDPQRARIVRIRNPAGRARTFSFDRGWRAVADVTTQEGSDED